MTTQTTRSPSRQHSLYRAVLSLAIAALIAASIPFAAIYVSTQNRPPSLAALAPSSHSGSVRLITTASGRQLRLPASAVSSTPAAPVTTRSSAAGGQND